MKEKITSRKQYDEWIIDEIERISNMLNLPKVVIDESIRIFIDATKSGYTRGRSFKLVIAVCIYTACRKMRLARSIDDISAATGIDKVELGKAYRALISKLNINIPIADPKDYIERIGRNLNLSDDTIKKAIEILENVKEKGYTVGKDPTGIAGAIIYIAALDNENVTQKKIASVAHVTEVTIRTRYKEIQKLLQLNDNINKEQSIKPENNSPQDKNT